MKLTKKGSSGAQIGPAAHTFYDGLSRPIASDIQGFDGTPIRSETEFDADGRVKRSSRPYFVGSTSIKWIAYTYDPLGRVTRTDFPDGSHSEIDYSGLTTVVTNQEGQTTTTVKNAQGLPESVADAVGNTTQYLYDPFDNLTQITDPLLNTTSNTYDIRGRKTASIDPDQGSWSYGYDQLNQLTSQTDAKGQVTSIQYDKLGRMTQRIEPGLTSTWTYDTAANGVGKLAQATTSAGYMRDHFYDDRSRPSQTRLRIGGTNFNYFTTYSTVTGRVDEVTYPSGLVLKYGYVAIYGYLKQLADDADPDLVFWRADIRDAEMHLLRQTTENGVEINQTFDANTGLVQTIKAGLGGGNGLAAFTYEFDVIGNLIRRFDNKTNLDETFDYDNRNRLRQVRASGVLTQNITYDPLGNIESKSGAGTYSYGAGSAGPTR